MNAATPERKPVTEEISGLIERVTFHNDESGFCVLRVRTRGHREETTVGLYGGDAKLLSESLEYVQRTSSQILNAIDADGGSAPSA